MTAGWVDGQPEPAPLREIIDGPIAAAPAAVVIEVDDAAGHNAVEKVFENNGHRIVPIDVDVQQRDAADLGVGERPVEPTGNDSDIGVAIQRPDRSPDVIGCR